MGFNSHQWSKTGGFAPNLWVQKWDKASESSSQSWTCWAAPKVLQNHGTIKAGKELWDWAQTLMFIPNPCPRATSTSLWTLPGMGIPTALGSCAWPPFHEEIFPIMPKPQIPQPQSKRDKFRRCQRMSRGKFIFPLLALNLRTRCVQPPRVLHVLPRAAEIRCAERILSSPQLPTVQHSL